MSFLDYFQSLWILQTGATFRALIMAAFKKAKTREEITRLRRAFPQLFEEYLRRNAYREHGPGVLPEEHNDAELLGELTR